MTDYGKRASRSFLGGSGCARAIAETFGGTADVYIDAAAELAAPFEHAETNRQELCGAIRGMYMAISMIYSPESDEAQIIASELTEKFRKKFGAVACRELISDTEQTQVPVADRMPRCAEYIEYAADLLARQLMDYGRI